MKSSALLLPLLVSGCGPEKEPDEIRTIRAYYVSPAECGPTDADGAVNIQLEAVGDFEPSARTSEFPSDGVVGLELGFPPETRGVEAFAELEHPLLTAKETRWSGVGLAVTEDVSLLLWPVRTACALWKPAVTASAFPLDAVGSAMGYLPERRTLLVAGSGWPSGDPRALVIDMGTGVVEQIAGPKIAFASVTPFGKNKLLIAGGIDPTQALAPGDNAVVFDATKRAFESQPIPLSRVRSRHGAVVLANGETLLVGGLDNLGEATESVETVSPKLPKDSAARTSAAVLEFPRVSPTVLRLSDDTILVAGGRSGPNPTDATQSALEWLKADGSANLFTLDKTDDNSCPSCGTIRVSPIHAFTTLPGGGALAVGLCVVAKASNDECENDVEQRVTRSIAWIRPDKRIHVLPPLLPPKTTFTQLVSGSDGSPWLFVISESPAQEAWLRFDLWGGSFEIPENAPTTGPEPDVLTGERLAPPLAVDPGLLVWLEQTRDVSGSLPRVVGFRSDTRNTYARQLLPLLVGSTDNIAPAIPPFESIDDGSEIRYDGQLRLTGPEAKVIVTDTTYANVDLEIIAGANPRVAFGDEWFGDSDCQWPQGSGGDLIVRRRGTSLTLEVDGEAEECAVSPGRHSISLGAPAGGGSTTIITSVTLTRR